MSGGLGGKGGISCNARMGEIGVGGSGSSTCRYHGSGSDGDDEVDWERDWRREGRCDNGLFCGREGRRSGCRDAEDESDIPAREVNVSRMEWRQVVQRVRERCILSRVSPRRVLQEQKGVYEVVLPEKGVCMID